MCWNVGNVSVANGCVWTLASFVFWAKLRVQKQKHITPHHPIYYKQQQKNKNKQLLTITLRAFRVDFLRAAFQLEFAKLIQNVEAGARKKQSACCQCRLFIVELLVQATKQQFSLRFTFHLGLGGQKLRAKTDFFFHFQP